MKARAKGKAQAPLAVTCVDGSLTVEPRAVAEGGAATYGALYAPEGGVPWQERPPRGPWMGEQLREGARRMRARVAAGANGRRAPELKAS